VHQDVVSVAVREESKGRFWAFRWYIRPTMKLGWWQHEVANELQLFYGSLVNGERPMLVLMAPPGHGKTELVTDFAAWVGGKQPDLKTILVSDSHKLGIDVNMDIQLVKGKANRVLLTVWQAGRKHVACLRTIKSLIQNMITGVTKVRPHLTRCIHPINTVSFRALPTKCVQCMPIFLSTASSKTTVMQWRSVTSWARRCFKLSPFCISNVYLIFALDCTTREDAGWCNNFRVESTEG